jgi:hypothetical protein
MTQVLTISKGDLSLLIVASLAISILVHLVFIRNISAATQSTNLTNVSNTISSVYEITTRGNLCESVDVKGIGHKGKYPLKTTEAELLRTCPPEDIIIFVHG